MTPILDAPAFRSLKDIDMFKQFGLDETIFLANGADIGVSRYFRLVRMVDCRIMLTIGYGNDRSAT